MVLVILGIFYLVFFNEVESSFIFLVKVIKIVCMCLELCKLDIL